MTQFKDAILASVASNSVTIITAETGAGKSTQVPQYLLEAGYEVVVTQPRRLAAFSVAERVAQEFGCELGQEIGFRTALDRAESEDTSCLFVTDGLQLVRELMGRVSDAKRVLVLDEVHEWNLNIETLVSWIRFQIDQGIDFKVVLMSATLEAGALSKFYDNAPVIEVPGRLFPVTTRTPSQSLTDDIVYLVSEGRNVLVFQPGKAEIEEVIGELSRREVSAEVLPLHGELTIDEQRKCFAHYGRPKVVVSTNVAQTSVTIDDIDAVVDNGMERRVELVDGVEGLYLRPISLADSKQRAGRAGRTKPGIYVDRCTAFNRRDFPVSEIERVRLDQAVLRLAMAGFNMEELRFFHQPDIAEIHSARESLVKLGCMTANGQVTGIGKQVSRFPVSVQFGRMIVEAIKLNVVADVVLAAAILENGEINTRKDKYGYPSDVWRIYTGGERSSDVIAQMQLYKAAEQMQKNDLFGNGIHQKAFQRVKNLCEQIKSSLVSRGVEMKSGGRRENIILAICAGMVDHLYTISYGQLRNGSTRERNRESVVALPSTGFAVGLPFDLEIRTRRGPMTLMLVRMLTIVSSGHLMQAAPQLVETRKGVNPKVNESGQVVSSTETWFNGHKVSEMTVNDPSHAEAPELLAEYAYRSFSYPNRPSIEITESTKVPEVVEVEIGIHGRTGDKLVVYGYYHQIEYWHNQITPKWSRDCAEAERMNAGTVNAVNAVIESKKEQLEKYKNAIIPVAAKLQQATSTGVTQDGLNALVAKFAR